MPTSAASCLLQTIGVTVRLACFTSSFDINVLYTTITLQAVLTGHCGTCVGIIGLSTHTKGLLDPLLFARDAS